MKNYKRAPKPDKNWDISVKRLFKAIIEQYQIDDPAGIEMLRAGCQNNQRLLESQKIIATEGSVVVDRFGQKREHPAVAIERGATSAMLQCFKALCLDFEPVRDKPGRPAGR